MIGENGTDLQVRIAELMGRSDACKRCGGKDLEFFEASIKYDKNHMPLRIMQEYICKSCQAHGLICWVVEFKYNAVPEPWNK